MLHTQFNSRVVTTVSTTHYQWVVIYCQLPSGQHKTFSKFYKLQCVKNVKDENVYRRNNEQNLCIALMNL